MLWYSLEAPQRGASDGYSQQAFSWKNKTNILSGYPLIWRYVMEHIDEKNDPDQTV